MSQGIAASLERAFSQYGFAEPGVARLKSLCQVSLRTLYKHYPSKEAMIVGALSHRHQRYLAFLQSGMPTEGRAAINHLFDRLGHWMAGSAPHGCLSMQALAAFPHNALIRRTVADHKAEVRLLLGQLCGRAELSTALFLLHEGAASAWPLMGDEAVVSARAQALHLMERETP